MNRIFRAYGTEANQAFSIVMLLVTRLIFLFWLKWSSNYSNLDLLSIRSLINISFGALIKLKVLRSLQRKMLKEVKSRFLAFHLHRSTSTLPSFLCWPIATSKSSIPCSGCPPSIPPSTICNKSPPSTLFLSLLHSQIP